VTSTTKLFEFFLPLLSLSFVFGNGISAPHFAQTSVMMPFCPRTEDEQETRRRTCFDGKPSPESGNFIRVTQNIEAAPSRMNLSTAAAAAAADPLVFSTSGSFPSGGAVAATTKSLAAAPAPAAVSATTVAVFDVATSETASPSPPSPSPPPAATAEAAAAAIQDAMLMLPDADKAAYLEALQQDAVLVARESNPGRFLECECQDPWKAAKRLACYWQHRKEIFGAERAFLPLHQTGTGGDVVNVTSDGGGTATITTSSTMTAATTTLAAATATTRAAALNEQDIEILNTGAVVQLPNDRQGRAVLATDHARYQSEHSFPHYHPCRLRMIFYMLSVVSEMPVSQQTGIVLLGLVTIAPNHDLVKRFTAMIKHAMPIRSVETHVVFLPSRVNYGSFVDKIIEHMFAVAGLFASTVFIHRGSTDAEVVKKLKTQGLLSKAGIPEWMGGSWKMEDFEKWKRQRIRFEQALLKTAEEKLQKKRKVNAVLSRQKRARQKSRLQQLQEQSAALTASNQRLATDNEQLEQYLQYAMRQAAILEEQQQQEQQHHQQQAAITAPVVASCFSSTAAPPAAAAAFSSSILFSSPSTTLPTTLTSSSAVARSVSDEPTHEDMPPDAASLCDFFTFN
jgi:hypothetical protein